jgi:predicted ATPase
VLAVDGDRKVDWSYELLPENEQIILRRLAVFQGEAGGYDKVGLG